MSHFKDDYGFSYAFLTSLRHCRRKGKRKREKGMLGYIRARVTASGAHFNAILPTSPPTEPYVYLANAFSL